MATRKPKSKDSEPDVQILTTTKCPAISGRGGGQINNSWIPFADILKLLESHSDGSSFSSAVVFNPIYYNQSRNNRGFTLAVALKEKLVVPQEGKRRKYMYNSPTAFLAKVDKLKAAKKPTSRRKAKN